MQTRGVLFLPTANPCLPQHAQEHGKKRLIQHKSTLRYEEITQCIYSIDPRAVSSSLKMKAPHSPLNLKSDATGFFSLVFSVCTTCANSVRTKNSGSFSPPLLGFWRLFLHRGIFHCKASYSRQVLWGHMSRG